MIRKLQRRLIAVAMTALLILLTVILAIIHVINYNKLVTEADTMLTMMAGNRGSFPDFSDNKRPPDMSPEAPYEARYFSVLIGKNSEILQVDTGRIKAVDTAQAASYATKVAAGTADRGFMKDFRFVRYAEDTAVRITFLDCGRKLDTFRGGVSVSCAVSLLGLSLFFLVVLFFSNRIIRPVAESYEKQKQFITNAGHEIKTPLTIIRADTDVLEMELGDNEWLTDIRQQTQRLTGLTNDLIYLARMEEANKDLPMTRLPVSELVRETAESFHALAQTREKTLCCQIQPALYLQGNENAVCQLVGILLDNALKYSPAHSSIRLTLEKQGKAVQLSVCNQTEMPVTKEQLSRLFERFYRADAARNSQTGGYGIGLSMAKAIADAHHGKIQAKTEDGRSLHITVSIPA